MALDDYVVTPDVERAVGQGILQESADKNCELGTELVLNDGRKFRYCLNGSGTLAAGKICDSRTWVANAGAGSAEANDAVNTAAAGATKVTVTTTGIVIANEYADGYLAVVDGSGATAGGEGQILKIKSHPAATAGATCVITLYDPIRAAFHADATVSLVHNPYSGVVISVASGGTEVGTEVGVPLIPVTAAYFFWAQFKGLSNVLIDGTPAIGTPLMRGSVAGSLALADSSFKEVATMHHTGVNTEYRPVILDIP